MSARRSKHPVVTLFAFQDVIMSVSGIIIVLVLMLSLELVERPELTASAAAAQAATELKRELDRADAASAELEKRVQEINEQLANSEGLSAAELQRQTEFAAAETDQLASEIAELEALVASLEKTDEELQVRSFDQQELRDQITAAQRKVDELEAKLAEERSDDRPLFSLPRGFNRQGWIAVLSKGEVAIAPLGRPSRPQVFAAPGGLSGESAGKRFLNWTRTQSASRLYVLLVIRPDGVSTFDEIAVGLEQRGIAFGFDLAAAGQNILHPDRGAYE